MESQTKVNLSHIVVSGVVATHGGKDMDYGAEVLLNGALPDGVSPVRQKSGVQAPRKIWSNWAGLSTA